MSVKRRLSLVCLLLVAAGSMFTVLALSPTPKEEPIETPLVQTAQPTPSPTPLPGESPTPLPVCYWVQGADGQVSVYHADDRTTPITITDIRLESLRETDQEMLRNGVLIQGEEDLSHFLEGFGP